MVRDRANRRKAFFLDGIRYRNAAAFENLADSGFARTLDGPELDALLGRMLAFLAPDAARGSSAPDAPEAPDASGPFRGSSRAF